MKNKVYVLREDYFLLGEKHTDIIAVLSSKDNAAKTITDYFGEDVKEIGHQTVEDSAVEWIKTLEITLTHKVRQEVTLTLEYFIIDEL